MWAGLRLGRLQVPGKAGAAAGWAVRIAVADATARAGQKRKRARPRNQEPVCLHRRRVKEGGKKLQKTRQEPEVGGRTSAGWRRDISARLFLV